MEAMEATANGQVDLSLARAQRGRRRVDPRWAKAHGRPLFAPEGEQCSDFSSSGVGDYQDVQGSAGTRSFGKGRNQGTMRACTRITRVRDGLSPKIMYSLPCT